MTPGRRTVRLAMGVGLWDAKGGKYLLPQPSATATQPGGSTASHPAAFFNVAFRHAEPGGANGLNPPAWWREALQAAALHDKGALTDAEFETLKKKLLGE